MRLFQDKDQAVIHAALLCGQLIPQLPIHVLQVCRVLSIDLLPLEKRQFFWLIQLGYR